MAYTYVGPVAGAFAIPVSEVRFLLGDTAPSAPLSLTDEEISYLLAPAGTTTRQAAAQAARRMAVAYDRKSQITSKSVAGLSLSYSYGTTAAAYRALADELEQDPEGGAFSILWDETAGWDSPPSFWHGQFDSGSQAGSESWTDAPGSPDSGRLWP